MTLASKTVANKSHTQRTWKLRTTAKATAKAKAKAMAERSATAPN